MCVDLLRRSWTDVVAAGIEFISTPPGISYSYDVSPDANRNPDAKPRAGRSGTTTLARYLFDEHECFSTPCHRRFTAVGSIWGDDGCSPERASYG